LGLIAANPGLAQIDIAREYDIDKATMVGLLDNLEAAGYVRRRKHPRDRRRNALTLTKKGVERFEDLKNAFSAQEASFTQSLTKAEIKVLMDLLDRIPLR
ncbi:MAG: MarR family winged helix-turn-helix transcriptional regulator, partial [Rhodospirillaceae bacterium]|nr:MarR family winged helix-turn-helix transcriptional regulator [Rhodospirillaceae bacterium]